MYITLNLGSWNFLGFDSGQAFKAESLVAMNSTSKKVRSESQGSRKAGRNKCKAEGNLRFQMLPAEPRSVTVPRMPSLISESYFWMIEG